MQAVDCIYGKYDMLNCLLGFFCIFINTYLVLHTVLRRDLKYKLSISSQVFYFYIIIIK